jgi:hypothetical protein
MKKYILASVLVVLIIAGIAVAKFGNFSPSSTDAVATSTEPVATTSKPVITDTQPIVCTMEAKICPDGSYVSRTGPKCEFKVCPAADSSANKVVQKLCHLEADRTYEVRLCGNYYNVFPQNVADAQTAYYDITGKLQGHCGGMPSPDGKNYDDPVCGVSMRCSDVNLCK